MIIAGLQTGNTRWLAAHLQNAADNETIDIVEVSGTVDTDIDGALAEFDAIATGTRARKGVYAAFVNPPEPLTRLQYARALFLIEQRLGLTGQPRIVLFHEKDGREHCHVVWSRIDLEHMRAIQLSFDRQKLRRCAQELAAEFGLELPPGLAEDRGAERFAALPQPTKAEKIMEERSGLSRGERRKVITDAYRNSDSADAFVDALEEAGFMLARGDKRVFVVVDTAGDVHSLARQIDGANTKALKKKLEGLTLSLLPPVERAKILMLQRAAAQQDARRENVKKIAEAKAAYERLKDIQSKRQAKVDILWQKMKVRHWHEWKVMLAHIKAEAELKLWRRYWLAAGLAAYLKKIAVIRKLIEYYEKRRKRSQEEQHQLLLASLKQRHENEEREIKRQHEALRRLERCEFQTVERKFGSVDIVTNPFADPRFVVSFERASEFVPNWSYRHEHKHRIFRQNASDIMQYSCKCGVKDVTELNHSYVTSFRQNAFDITASNIHVNFGDDAKDSVKATSHPFSPTGIPL